MKRPAPNPLFWVAAGLFMVALSLFSIAMKEQPIAAATTPESGNLIRCQNPFIFDGDTFECAKQRIRLASIDAPEINGHCAPGRRCTPGDSLAAKAHLTHLTRTIVTCRRTDIDHYGRTIAECTANGIDLSCAMVEGGHAVERYGRLDCK